MVNPRLGFSLSDGMIQTVDFRPLEISSGERCGIMPVFVRNWEEFYVQRARGHVSTYAPVAVPAVLYP